MEGSDGSSPGGGILEGRSGFQLQPWGATSISLGGGFHTTPALRPTGSHISLASPRYDGGPSSPHNQIIMTIGQSGNYPSPVGLGDLNASRSDSQKRKRGRPRKYLGIHGGGVKVGASPALTSGATAAESPASPSEKRARGRPPGASKINQLPSLGCTWKTGTAGSGFTPHVITVAAGEDVANKISAFSQHRFRAVCVLSANGSISNVTLRHYSSFGGSITYEGRYEILSLSGSFLPADNNGSCSRTGGLSVSLAASDGKVVGGSVSGLLVAATPVQIVVGSFVVPEGGTKTLNLTIPSIDGNGESTIALMSTSIGLSPPIGTAGVTVAAVPPSVAWLSKTEPSESQGPISEGPSSTGHNQGGNAFPNTHHILGQFGGWNPALVESGKFASTDINISLPGG